jgi:hypothetical protein
LISAQYVDEETVQYNPLSILGALFPSYIKKKSKNPTTGTTYNSIAKLKNQKSKSMHGKLIATTGPFNALRRDV